MKVLHVNIVYPNGSTGKIVECVHNFLKQAGEDSVIYYGRGIKLKEKNIYKIAPEYIMRLQSLQSKLTGYAYAGAFISTNLLLKSIELEKPDVVHLHCINGHIVNIYKLLNYLKSNDIPTVITLHAEFMFTAGCAHSLNCEKWKFGCGGCPQKGNGRPSSRIFDRSAEEWKMMSKSFHGFKNVAITSVSEWLNNKATLSPFFKDKDMHIIQNGIDTENIFKPTDYSNLKLRYGLTDEKIILYVTPDFDHPIKGGKYVLDIARELLNSNVKIIIAGKTGKNTRWPANVILVNHITNSKEMAALYSMANLTIITSKNETFSMVTAESLSCGTPVVGFKSGGPETIAIDEYSKFVEQGNFQNLIAVINQWLTYKMDVGPNCIARKAKKVYSQFRMNEEYHELYRGLIK